MTNGSRNLKTAARNRQKATGESYTEAMSQVKAQQVFRDSTGVDKAREQELFLRGEIRDTWTALLEELGNGWEADAYPGTSMFGYIAWAPKGLYPLDENGEEGDIDESYISITDSLEADNFCMPEKPFGDASVAILNSKGVVGEWITREGKTLEEFTAEVKARVEALTGVRDVAISSGASGAQNEAQRSWDVLLNQLGKDWTGQNNGTNLGSYTISRYVKAGSYERPEGEVDNMWIGLAEDVGDVTVAKGQFGAKDVVIVTETGGRVYISSPIAVEEGMSAETFAKAVAEGAKEFSRAAQQGKLWKLKTEGQFLDQFCFASGYVNFLERENPKAVTESWEALSEKLGADWTNTSVPLWRGTHPDNAMFLTDRAKNAFEGEPQELFGFALVRVVLRTDEGFKTLMYVDPDDFETIEDFTSAVVEMAKEAASSQG